MNGGDQKFLERLPLAADRPLLGYGAAAALAALCIFLRLEIEYLLPPGFPYVTLFPAVIFSAFLFGRGPGIFAAIICGIAAWYLFIPPTFAFKFDFRTIFSMLFYIMVVSINIVLVHWMQSANRRMVGERERTSMLAERSGLLFRELQHRVSNNLQVVAALLTLQKRDVTDPQARAALDEAARRLGLIGKIHRQLHDPNGSQIGMGTFLRQLCADLIDAGGKPGIVCWVEAEDLIQLDADAAIPVALIVAESVSNALEHGFSAQEDGRIIVRLQRLEDSFELTIADNGAGLPEGFDIAKSTSLGLRIATTLARQLGGAFEMYDDHGAVARLVLPAA
jgi:two-component sensor histidine kinase